jgi:hypothetical protein
MLFVSIPAIRVFLLLIFMRISPNLNSYELSDVKQKKPRNTELFYTKYRQ